MGAFGLVLLMALASMAVVGFLRRFTAEYSVWTRLIAPGLAAIGLVALFVVIVANFNVLIGTGDFTVLSWLLPAIVLVPGLFGTVWAWWLRAERPATYRGIGQGGELD
jgi:hypothetical protein